MAAAAVAAADKRRRFRLTEAGVALVALLVSGAAFLGDIALYLRGSEIAVLPPEHFVLYRDTGPNGSDLYLAVPVAIINAARADYGDVVTKATATIHSARKPPGRFSYEAVVEPVLSSNVEQALTNCPEGSRCIPATGFYVIERPASLLDVPGGASRSEYLSFYLSTVNCMGEPLYCAAFADFASAVAVLRRETAPVIRIELQFYFDRKKVIECRLAADDVERRVIFDYLERTGWAMPSCTEIHEQEPLAGSDPKQLTGRNS